jgi:hypothetical protein
MTLVTVFFIKVVTDGKSLVSDSDKDETLSITLVTVFLSKLLLNSLCIFF